MIASRRWRCAHGAALSALLALLIAALASTAAMAHAVLISAEPADGAMVVVSPDRLTLSFNEPVSPLVLRLIGPGGVERSVALKSEGALIGILPAGELQNGTHLLSWRVASADGHPVGGTVVFSVGHASASVPQLPAGETALKSAIWIARFAIYIALFAGVGGAFFVCLFGGCPPYAMRRILHAALFAGLLAAPVSIGLQGADLLGVSLINLAGTAVWMTGLRSAYAITAAIAFLSVFAARFSLSTSSQGNARLASSAAFAGAGLALAASGHAGTAEPQWLMRPAVFVHALAIAFWGGALFPLAGALLARTEDALLPLRRFSGIAPFAVAALIVSGVLLAFIQVEHLSALWRTDYGLLLCVKFGLLAVLLAVAVYNRAVLAGRVMMNETAARKLFVCTIGVEIALMLGIFAIAASWRFTPPPRALVQFAAAPASIHVHTSRAMADISFSTRRAGPVTVVIRIMTGEFSPLDAKEVLLVLSRKDADIEPVRRPATKREDGTWNVGDLYVPLHGPWIIRVDILVGDFEKISLEDNLVFQPM